MSYQNSLEWMFLAKDPNYDRILAWAVRAYKQQAILCHGEFQEYLPYKWRIRLPASGIDILIGEGGFALIYNARHIHEVLKNAPIKT